MSPSSSSDLSNEIRAALLQDPRTQSLTPDELNQAVSALSTNAQKQGITASNIAYRPGTAYQAPSAGYVAPASSSASYIVPIALLAFAVCVVAVWFRFCLRKSSVPTA
jgi:hypothetical protein